MLFDKTKPANLHLMLLPVLLAFFAFSQAVYGSGHEVTRVHDGDTIRVKGDSGEMTIRLAGIDAPEKSKRESGSGQPFSQKATEYLAGLVLNKSVDVRQYGVDRYGRILGIVEFEGQEVNLEIMKMGYAEVYRGKHVKGFDLAPYLAAEKEAMEKKRGMWVQGSEYVSPKDWRKGQSTGPMKDRPRSPHLQVISAEEGLGY